MLAVVKEGPGPGFTLKEVEKPIPGKGEVLIAVKSVGICGSDIPIFKGIRAVSYPLVPGHEFSGDIVEVGTGVKGYKPGDRVTSSIVINCGRCFYCREGEETLCERIREIGIHVNGAFAQYVIVPEHTLHHMPDGMTYNQGASIDPVASAYRAVRKAHITVADVVIVFGPGPIGLYALQLATLEGAKKIIMVGTRDERLEIAKTLGADLTINIRQQSEYLGEIVKKFTEGHMADVVIEATGRPDTVESCITCVCKGGRVILAGVFHESAVFSVSRLVRSEARIEGSICYTWNEFEVAMGLISTSKVEIKPIVTHELPLSQMSEALKLIDRRQALKVILHP